MNENIKWFAAAVVVVGGSIGAVLYFSRGDEAPPPAKPAAAASAKADVPPDEDVAAHPLPESATPEPPTPLAQSDAPLQNAVSDLVGKEAADRYFVPDDLVRHLVVSIDNLTDQKVAERMRPLKPVPGAFVASGADDAPVLDAANFARYTPLVQMVSSIETGRLVASYARYYPAFQEAYESLGHKPRYFNDRLIAVIDNLLAAPDVPGPIALARPNVQYEFADPKLEALGAGQKLLIRMGPENSAALKSKLRELRTALLSQPKS